ncbi:chromosome partitioning protein ParA [Vibrio sp. V39_P1S14PM300]|uniref:chromosome partitioning protein ParA n=1 Tax=Vibrio sp. V39_P1S14PM300 TaxID=1938690 RepID=UPI001372C798|nr:chromosome partitioning protein ParA [Vibrio sp. V39_P1S14PM300]NAX21192.1 chromosome partitioning protein ParA [Vibrio sp. V39_P1S14PM300]
MNRLISVTVLAVVAGTLWWRYSSAPVSTVLSPEPVSAPDQPSGSSGLVPESVPTPSSVSPSRESSERLMDLAKRFEYAQGRAFVFQVEAFWRECLDRDSCALELDLIQTMLTPERYQLIAHYQRLNQEWQQSLGSTSLSDFATLQARVEEVKRLAQQTWGEAANIVFADEFAVYDFSLETQQLATESPDQFVQSYRHLLNQWHKSEAAIGLVSSAAKYERGLSLIPHSYSQTQREQVSSQLAAMYLSDAEANDIQARAQQVAEQTTQTQSYQQQLERLKRTLEQQRQSRFANLTDSEWQQYYDDQISEFRISFFSG